MLRTESVHSQTVSCITVAAFSPTLALLSVPSLSIPFSRSFLMKEAAGSTYRSAVGLLFGRLSPTLLNQVLNRIEEIPNNSNVKSPSPEP